jgi:hypothetical protein
MAMISASPARAQSVLWVSASGNDANSCAQTAPCATFQGAINKGNVSQISCLTSGNYGPVVITASITIDCGTGNVGNVVVSNGSAITINASSSATIVLRHLHLNGGVSVGSFPGGIFASLAGGTLIVEDCTIHNFVGFIGPGGVNGSGLVGAGIFFAPFGGRALLQVSNSQIFSNVDGIDVASASGQIASVALNQVELVGNSRTGLSLGGTGIVAGTMRDSIAEGNLQTGVLANASQVYFTIEESSIVANLTSGIQTSSAGALLNVGASTIGGNSTGVFAQQGSILSFGNNQMSANGSNGNFTSTTPLR